MVQRYKFAVLSTIILTLASAGWTQASASPTTDAGSFPPFQNWMGAVLTGDASTLTGLYSNDPPAEISVKAMNYTADADTTFWLDLKVRSMKADIVRLVVRPDRASVIFRAAVVAADGRTLNVTDAQGWQRQGDQWRIVGVERTDNPQLKQPSDMKKDIYPASANAHAELKEAEQKAAREHKRLLLVFGANWCFDCHVLDLAFHGSELAPIVSANYEVVHIDLGPEVKKNSDLVKEYDIPVDKGIPALAVAESDGKLLVSQKNGEFQDARSLTPDALAEFLNKWKPQAH